MLALGRKGLMPAMGFMCGSTAWARTASTPPPMRVPWHGCWEKWIMRNRPSLLGFGAHMTSLLMGLDLSLHRERLGA